MYTAAALADQQERLQHCATYRPNGKPFGKSEERYAGQRALMNSNTASAWSPTLTLSHRCTTVPAGSIR